MPPASTTSPATAFAVACLGIMVFSAMDAVMKAKSKNEILTGLLYLNPNTPDLHEILDTNERPLNSLTEKDLCPGAEILKGINDSFR